MGTKSLRIDESLVILAKRRARVEHRSINEQIQYWAKLGRAIASKISVEEAFSVTQGLKEIHLKPSPSISVDPDAVLNALEADRSQGFSGKPVTSAPFYFEASQSKSGLLDKVNALTGERQTGRFQDGKFETV